MSAASTGVSIPDLTTAKTIILGVVEGITEFLPISSSGHLIFAERWLGLGPDKVDKVALDAFTVVVQIGAILAVVGVYRRRFVSMFNGVLGKSISGRKVLYSVLAGFVPAAVIGKAFNTKIKDHLLKPWPVVIAWLVGGVLILLFAKIWGRGGRIRRVEDITPVTGFVIGLAQAVALMPGTSRSLVTIMAALLVGCSMAVAVEYSFLLGFVTLSAATVFELAKDHKALTDAFGYGKPLLATVVAGIVAFASVKFMINWLNRKGLKLFAYYRFAAAAVGIFLILTHRLGHESLSALKP